MMGPDLITFKIFGPGDTCRRVTWPGLPQLKAINDVADDLVQIPAEKRAITYVDSEGDRVEIKTGQDLEEAVRDARRFGVKTVKLSIRPRRQWRGRCGNEASSCASGRRATTDKKQSDATTRSRCGWQRGRCHFDGNRGSWRLFGPWPRTHVKIGLADDVCAEWADAVNTLFAHIFISDPDASENQDCNESSRKTTKCEKQQDGADSEAVADGSEKQQDGDGAEAVVDSSEKQATSFHQSATSVPTAADKGASLAKKDLADKLNGIGATTGETTEDETAVIEEAGSADYEMVDEKDPSSQLSSPYDNAASESHEADAELSAKVKLLRDMGFNLPTNVARNMIEEMGGRMDLIVRALVNNSK